VNARPGCVTLIAYFPDPGKSHWFRGSSPPRTRPFRTCLAHFGPCVHNSLSWVVGHPQVEACVDLGLVFGGGGAECPHEILMVVTVVTICSLVILTELGRVLPVAARRRALAASLRAWVSVIHWPTTAGSAPESSALRYWASFWPQSLISSSRAASSRGMASSWLAARVLDGGGQPGGVE
jgi:hypothetical protein